MFVTTQHAALMLYVNDADCSNWDLEEHINNRTNISGINELWQQLQVFKSVLMMEKIPACV